MKKSLLVTGLVIASWLIVAQSCFTFRTADKKAKESFAAKGVSLQTNTVTKNGQIIHYAATGNVGQPTLVFIHGTPGSWTAFEQYLADSTLRSKFRMVSIDRPGFGYSRFGKAYPLQAQSQWIGAVIEDLKNDAPLWLVGHSLGGPLVLQLSIDYPEIATGLVVISGSIDPAAEKPEKWRNVLEKTPLKLFLPGAFRPSNTELIYLKQDLKEQESKLNLVKKPVYFIHGRKDSWVPPINVQYGLTHLSNAPSIDTLWLNGGHFIPWTSFDSIRQKLVSLY